VWRCGRTLDNDEATQGKALLCRYLCNEPQSRYGYLERHAPFIRLSFWNAIKTWRFALL
jgi:hypothetical protein